MASLPRFLPEARTFGALRYQAETRDFIWPRFHQAIYKRISRASFTRHCRYPTYTAINTIDHRRHDIRPMILMRRRQATGYDFTMMPPHISRGHML